MKKDIKLIALDMDGTVLTNQKQVTPYTEKVLRTAAQKGIWIVPTTGRPLSNIPTALSADYVRYVITSAGADVVDRDKNISLYSNYMAPKAVQRILDHCRENGFYHEWFIGGKPCTDSLDIIQKYGAAGTRADYAHMKAINLQMADIAAYIQQQGGTAEKMNVFVPPSADYQTHWDWFASAADVVLTESDESWIEINKAGANKADGLKQLCKSLGIERQQVMAVGDNDNDKEMLAFAGLSVAMGNGIDKIKQMAQFVTKTNDEDGVAFAVEQFVLNA